METTIVYWIGAALLVVVGLIGLVLPAIPGALLILAGLILGAWAEGFAHVGLWTIAILTVMAGLTYAVDFWATMFGVKKFSASKRAVIGALIGIVAGLFLGLARRHLWTVHRGSDRRAVSPEKFATGHPCRHRRHHRHSSRRRAQNRLGFSDDRNFRGDKIFVVSGDNRTGHNPRPR